MRGVVHDGHAWYGFGGVAGHAGLFSTAIDLCRYGQMWVHGGALHGKRLLPERLVAEATSNQAPVNPGEARRGYGWRLLPRQGAPEGDIAESGRGLGPRAYGHTGFTGTSLWIDPDANLVIVLLTNRLHPVATPAYLETRARFTAAVAAALGP
jgi:CubicO group peptidase (beta-lactamase class C family)